MEFYKFILKEESLTEVDENQEPLIVAEHDINILQPFLPDTFGMIMKHMTDDNLIEVGKLVIEQYMHTAEGKNQEAVELQHRLLSDGRLLMSAVTAMVPLFGLCGFELKKN